MLPRRKDKPPYPWGSLIGGIFSAIGLLVCMPFLTAGGLIFVLAMCAPFGYPALVSGAVVEGVISDGLQHDVDALSEAGAAGGFQG